MFGLTILACAEVNYKKDMNNQILSRYECACPLMELVTEIFIVIYGLKIGSISLTPVIELLNGIILTTYRWGKWDSGSWVLSPRSHFKVQELEDKPIFLMENLCMDHFLGKILKYIYMYMYMYAHNRYWIL